MVDKGGLTMNDFRFWCYKVLPLVYDDSLSYYETLCKFIEYLNGLGEDVKEVVKEMQDLKDYVDNFIDTLDIESVVETKLNEMLENGDFDAIFASVSDTSTTVPVQYAGDIILDRMHAASAALVISSLQLAYILCPLNGTFAASQRSDNGILYVADLINNEIVTSYTVKCGHGNSMCYDPDREQLFIIPTFTYISGERVSTNKIYTYYLSKTDGILDTESLSEITGPATLYGITFNNTTDSTRGVYFIDYTYQMYKLGSGGTYATYLSPLPLTQSKDFESGGEQGFAMKGSRIITTSARGEFHILQILSDNSIKRVSDKFIENHDVANGRPFGEMEDIEFDSNGELWAAATMSMCYTIVQASMVRVLIDSVKEKNSGFSTPFATLFEDGYKMSAGNTIGQWNITNGTISRFRNNPTEMKHPMQVNYWNRITSITRLIINTNHNFGELFFTTPATLELVENKPFTFSQITVDNGNLEIHAPSSSANQLKIDGSLQDAFIIRNSGSLSLSGSALSINNERGQDININVATGKPLTSIRELPTLVNAETAALKIGTTDIESPGLYWGMNQLAIVTP